MTRVKTKAYEREVPVTTAPYFDIFSILFTFTERGIVQMNKGGLDFIWINDKGEWPNTGTYQCIATNDFGNAASRKATVQIASELLGDEIVSNFDQHHPQ